MVENRKMAPMQNGVPIPVQMLMQNFVQSSVQILVQKSVQNTVQRLVQNPVQPQRGDLSIDGDAQIFL
jgi:hypothetical protein